MQDHTHTLISLSKLSTPRLERITAGGAAAVLAAGLLGAALYTGTTADPLRGLAAPAAATATDRPAAAAPDVAPFSLQGIPGGGFLAGALSGSSASFEVAGSLGPAPTAARNVPRAEPLYAPRTTEVAAPAPGRAPSGGSSAAPQAPAPPPASPGSDASPATPPVTSLDEPVAATVGVRVGGLGAAVTVAPAPDPEPTPAPVPAPVPAPAPNVSATVADVPVGDAPPAPPADDGVTVEVGGGVVPEPVSISVP